MTGQLLRIFAHAPRRNALARPRREVPELIRITEPSDPEPAPQLELANVVTERIELAADAPAPSHDPADVLAPAIEQHIVDILASSPQYGETIDAAYRRKERELAAVFDSLTRSEASTLHRRLAEPRPEDVLAIGFARLVVDRRTRLLAVLADVPRREARRR